MAQSKKISRDNFSDKVKKQLASRVAYRCSYPDCGVLTIGPGSNGDNGFVTIGQAAHIEAASPDGPRGNPAMTAIERSAFENGIWLCNNHARLIDANVGNYSADTLRQWKAAAETETYRQLRSLSKGAAPDPETIVSLHPMLLFKAIWTAAEADTWRFLVKDFIYGNLQQLREYLPDPGRQGRNYIIVESQGDGRLIREHFSWKQVEDTIEIEVKVFPPEVRRSPEHIGKGMETGANMLDEKGRVNLISGVPLAIQHMNAILSTAWGTRFFNAGYGSYFSIYFNAHQNDLALLNHLIKVELTRLITIPSNPENPAGPPELNFINRVQSAEVSVVKDGKVELNLVLEWGNGVPWTGTLILYPDPAAPLPNITSKFAAPTFVSAKSAGSPLSEFKTLTVGLDQEEMTVSFNDESVMLIFKEMLPKLSDRIETLLSSDVFPHFIDHYTTRTFDNYNYQFTTSYDLELYLIKRGPVRKVGVHVSLKGFKKAGLEAFDSHSDLYVYFEDYHYQIGVSRQSPWLKLLYGQLPTAEQLEKLVNDFIDHTLKRINEQIRNLGDTNTLQ